MLCCAVLCYAMLCCAVLCYAMLPFEMLCYAMDQDRLRWPSGTPADVVALGVPGTERYSGETRVAFAEELKSGYSRP